MCVSFRRSYCSIKLPLLSNTTSSPMQMHPLEMRGSLRAEVEHRFDQYFRSTRGSRRGQYYQSVQVESGGVCLRLDLGLRHQPLGWFLAKLFLFCQQFIDLVFSFVRVRRRRNFIVAPPWSLEEIGQFHQCRHLRVPAIDGEHCPRRNEGFAFALALAQ